MHLIGMDREVFNFKVKQYFLNSSVCWGHNPVHVAHEIVDKYIYEIDILLITDFTVNIVVLARKPHFRLKIIGEEICSLEMLLTL